MIKQKTIDELWKLEREAHNALLEARKEEQRTEDLMREVGRRFEIARNINNRARDGVVLAQDGVITAMTNRSTGESVKAARMQRIAEIVDRQEDVAEIRQEA